MSVSAWVYWTGGSDTSIIADKSNGWDASQMMWTWGINPSTQKINFVSAGSSDFQTSISSAGFAMNEWHHLIVTHDSSNHAAQLYVDMKLVNTGTLVMGSKTDATIHFGIDAGGRYFRGKLDDVQIYNYVLDDRGILDAYNGAALNKKKVCLQETYDGRFDLSGPEGIADCQINIYDIIPLAVEWLSCGLYPAEACGQ